MSEPTNREVTILNAALELPSGQRGVYLDKVCAGDAALRQQVEALLKAHEQAEDFMEGPSAGLDFRRTDLVNVPLTEKPGDKIGRYKLLQQIGEGGCGVVYMAEQEEPVRRRVALKVIKLGMDTKSVIARFEAERQALAMMDHQNIAKVLDAGATNTGRPYFVMELVRGIKITDYCDQNDLSTKERLDLFIQVCRAIQHAHQKGVIHRDIKPSNILVTVDDGVPLPKVIDFGIAKATEGKLTDQTVFTAFEQFIGTPAYMSPEQAEMSARDVDTRSDIYSLGVLLYELLTGRTPFDTKKLLQAGLDEIRRTIRQDEPPRPSTCLSTMLGAELTAIAKHRKAEPPRLIHLVRGDLDWIVMKALEKDRARRYETANGLAMDIKRHLNCEPVVARPPSRLYEFQKTVRRHKFGFAATAALITVLAAGVLVSLSETIRARRAEREQARLRQQAETEAAKSQQVTQFLEDMLDGVSPWVALGQDTTMLREILDKTAERVGKDLKDQPVVEAELRSVIGNTYRGIGHAAEAEAMHREALVAYRKLLGNENPYVADLLNTLAGEASDLNKQAEAETLEREALAMRKKLLGGEHLTVAESLDFLAIVLLRQSQSAAAPLKQSKLAEAETLERDALAMRKRLLGSAHLTVAQSLDGLGVILAGQGKLTEAETLRREALAMERQVLGNDENLTVAIQFIHVAETLTDQGKYAEAETLYRQGLALERKLFSNDNPQLAYALGHFATSLQREGKLAEAESMHREALAMWLKYLPEGHPYISGTMSDLAGVLRDEGKLAEAESLFRETLAIRRKALGNDQPATTASLNSLIDVLQREDKLAEAERLIDGLLTQAAGSKSESAKLLCARGELRARAGRWNEAVVEFSNAAGLNPNDEESSANLALVLLKMGRNEECRRQCHELLAQAATNKVGVVSAATLAKASLLLPVDGPDLERACELADFVAPGGRVGQFSSTTKALAEYRRGRFDSANDWAKDVISKSAADPSRLASGWFIQALACARLQQIQLARTALTRGNELMNQSTRDSTQNSAGSWRYWIFAEVSGREAKTLLEGQPAATSK